MDLHGAFIRLKQYPASPREEARVGLAGPIWGLGAAAAAYGTFNDAAAGDEDLETFLARMLDVPWDEVHDDAEQMEHVVSAETSGVPASEILDDRNNKFYLAVARV